MAQDAVIPYQRGADAHDAPPEDERKEQLLPLAGALLWQNLGGLFLLNLLSVAAIVPVVGVGLLLGLVPTMVLAALVVYPALVGLMGSAAGWLRNEPQGFWHRYWRTVRVSALPAIGLGLLFHVYVYGYLLTVARLGEDNGIGIGTVAIWIAQSAFLVLLVMMLGYALPLLSLYGMRLRPAIRNSLLLVMAEPLMAVGLVGLLILLGAALVWIGVGIALIAPIIIAVVFVVNAHLQVQRINTGQRRQARRRA